MLFFVNTLTLECPVYEGHIKFEHGIDQALTYPEYTLPSEYAPVIQAPQPEHDPYTHIVEAVQPPTLTDGAWVQGWVLRALTDEELARLAETKAAMEAELAANGSPATPSSPPSLALLVEIP